MTQLNLGRKQDTSSAMGPGKRAVIWVRGCSIHCPGCITPELIDHRVRTEVSVQEICDWLSKMKMDHEIEGVSFSGGEPFEQAKALSEIAIFAHSIGLSTLSWSGYTRPFLEKDHAPHGSQDFLANLDVLIDGPYIRQRVSTLALRGSTNQHLHLLTDRYKETDFEQQYVELVVSPDATRLVGVANHNKFRIALALSSLLSRR